MGYDYEAFRIQEQKGEGREQELYLPPGVGRRNVCVACMSLFCDKKNS